ncbi:MAG: M56 family metallopeptidase [Bacteroidetes bacterium]|nr:M56 family metallopeptidase [Bacteroidota bacterium]
MLNQANFLQSLGWGVINSLWQLAFLWVIYQLITAVFKKTRPAARGVLSAVLLTTGFVWFIYTFFTAYTGNSSGHSNPVFFGGYGNEDVNQWLSKVLPAASLVYLVLLLLPLMRFIRNYRYVQVLRQYGLSKIDPERRLFVDMLAKRMGIGRPVHIWLSEWVTSPITVGWLKPVILVPLAAVNHLSPQQMEAVLLHELAHIRRYDYLLNLILNFIRTVLYFNPFARAFLKIVETEREKSCDEMVLQFQYDAHQYASALLTLEKTSRDFKILILGAAGAGKDLLHRIETIMGVQQKQKKSFQRFTGLLATLFCIISVNAILVLGNITGSPGISYKSRIAATPITAVNYNSINPATEEMELAGQTLLNHPGHSAGSGIKKPLTPNPVPVADIEANPDLIQVNFNEKPGAELDKEEEAIIKEAMESSKKVLEGTQWKMIEKSLADVFSRQEKEQLKAELKNEMYKFDWESWENKLRLAYDNVNWEKVSNQLNNAIYRLRTDSVIKVYSEALGQISLARKELQELCIPGIPDTDISLKSLAEKQRQLQKEINRLKAARQKKIVHL